jgi:epoxyqueuosine reductase
MTPERAAFLVKAHACALGFDAVGVTDLRPVPHGDVLRAWLDAGHAGSMRYMHRQLGRRLAPATIAPNTTRAIVVTRNYFAEDPPPRRGGRVARYARGRDYHEALRGPLDALATFVRSLGTSDTVAKPYVDAGPVPERELAQRAGLGWIGKNTMLIDPRRGSYCFLATILTNLELAVDLPFEADRCGRCHACLDQCPTDAFVAEHVLDSRRCISYLTIEARETPLAELHDQVGDWIFGCDVCQEVCPWNQRFARPARDPALEHDPALAFVNPAIFDDMNEHQFAERFGRTALTRPGLEGMRRNAAVVSHNTGARAGRGDRE